MASTTDQPKVKVTISDSDAYKDRTAEVMATALLDNPLWRAWHAATDENRAQVYYDFIRPYFSSSPEGCDIAEVEDFSVCAAWQPPGPVRQYQPPKEDIDPEEYKVDKAFYENFEEHVQAHFGNNYYRLIVMARDPRKPKVTGGVRAVLEVVLARATADKAAVYLSTTNPHARDIYLHFGFRLLLVQSYKGNESWSMMWTPETITPVKI